MSGQGSEASSASVFPAEGDEAPISMAPPSMQVATAYRPGGARPSSVPPPAEQEVCLALADVLIAAALADGEACERERRAMRRIFRRLLGTHELPGWLERHLTGFDQNSFDLVRATERLRHLPAEQRRHVAELVREVCDADHVYDLDEERYLLGLVLALSLGQAEVDDLVVHSGAGIDGPLKRALDLVVAGGVVGCAWPLFAAIACAVKWSSPGPVLFAQRRYGRGGKEIRVFKFRSMRVTEDGAVVRQATKGDARVTPVGAFLRRTSLDELPQFFNVLFGDMSVVGPRPHAVAHNEHYRTQILEYTLRHKVKPGITGWAQVNGWRGETDTLRKMIERVAHDLHYIKHYSLALDVRIILMTAFGRKVRQNAH
ncbi:MAG TPA: exopolysaccharide biosynthesis polyprenyl glycosylphosphotransferase [Polyangiaceae bacterium]|nr:exopolysaccharide biosynthesis polyprenyl glycosylphosphotransferase [Polyangiaceae bacterium]